MDANPNCPQCRGEGRQMVVLAEGMEPIQSPCLRCWHRVDEPKEPTEAERLQTALQDQRAEIARLSDRVAQLEAERAQLVVIEAAASAFLEADDAFEASRFTDGAGPLKTRDFAARTLREALAGSEHP